MTKGYIYQLKCSKTGNIYFGSTINPTNRYAQHTGPKNNTASSNFVNPKMKILEEIDFEDRVELNLLEKDYITNNECVNKLIPLRDRKEWILEKLNENPDYYKDQYKIEKLKERNINTRVNCICGGHYPKRNRKIHEASQKHRKFIEENGLKLDFD